MLPTLCYAKNGAPLFVPGPKLKVGPPALVWATPPREIQRQWPHFLSLHAYAARGVPKEVSVGKFVTLGGSYRLVRPRSKLSGPVDNSEIVTITVLLRSKNNRDELEKLVREQSTKPLAERNYLSKA